MKPRPVITTSAFAALVLVFAFTLSIRPVAAQDTGLTVTLTASPTKAKIGTFVEFTVRIENTGTEIIPAVAVNLGLPDALDARAVYCPGDNQGIVTYCELGSLAPGTITEVQFYVEIGSKETNGPVTVSVSSGGTVLATDEIAPIKVIGPRR
jgi:uncharacterized repeat protein (TIGR01451 family)